MTITGREQNIHSLGATEMEKTKNDPDQSVNLSFLNVCRRELDITAIEQLEAALNEKMDSLGELPKTKKEGKLNDEQIEKMAMPGFVAQAKKINKSVTNLQNLALKFIDELSSRSLQTLYRLIPLSTILTLILAACSTVNAAPSAEIPNNNETPVGEVTDLPEQSEVELTPSLEITPTPTELSIESIVNQYLEGKIDWLEDLTVEQTTVFISELANSVTDVKEIDLSNLSNEQREAFSIAYVEKLNEERGVNVAVYSGNEEAGIAYLDPETLTMRQKEDGKTDKEQTITMFYPVRVN
ncbi:MAG: hypothetical protein JXI43_07885 [Tissierellales bacterium]|nr:hypothetical protein [Tissierellales bacterium]